ncbi:MAG: class I adenylate-forming enzyme family protein [Acidimicrobiales bacterium]
MRGLVVGDILEVTARRAPARVCATLGPSSLTFGQVEERCTGLLRALAARGVGPGRRVAWWGDTGLDAIPLWFAVARLGAVFVPVNPKATPEEADQLLGLADPALVVGDDAHPAQVGIGTLLADRSSSGVVGPAVDEDSPHVIFFTSGSSGRPKGVVLSHRVSRIRVIGDASPFPSGPIVCMFPQFHMAGWFGPMIAWGSADEVVFVERAEADPLLEAVDRRRAVRLYAIPAVWRRILEADRAAYDLGSLVHCDTGTSATTPELLRSIAEAFPGSDTTITYGSTEAGSVCRLWPDDVRRKPGSVGPPAILCDVALADDGELLVRSPVLMSGYFRDDEATAEALAGGWFHTGDLAERDDEGYYSIVGRAKEVIRTGGETVAPAEVDTVLLAMGELADAAVAGVPDDDWGEIVTAFVVPRPGVAVDLAMVRAHCEGRLAAFKHPRALVVLEAIPRTGATRQVQRRRLVAQALADRR